jgi:DNA-binding transcriptional LysR family regulator
MEKLDAYAVFLKVARHGSYAAAARDLGISRSYASRQVTALEQRLGVRLLGRTTRKVTTTPAGEEVLAALGPLVDGLVQVEAALLEQRLQVRGSVRLTVPAAFGERYLVPVLLEFQEKYPDVALSVSFLDHKVDLLRQRFDVAVRGGAMPDSSLIARRLWGYQMQVVASPAYLAAHGEPGHPAELQRHTCLRYLGNQPADRWSFRHPDGHVVVTPALGPLEATSPLALALAAARGHGIARQPDFVVNCLVREGALVRLLTDWDAGDGAFYAVLPHRSLLPRAHRVLVEHLAGAFPVQPWSVGFTAASSADP